MRKIRRVTSAVLGAVIMLATAQTVWAGHCFDCDTLQHCFVVDLGKPGYEVCIELPDDCILNLNTGCTGDAAHDPMHVALRTLLLHVNGDVDAVGWNNEVAVLQLPPGEESVESLIRVVTESEDVQPSLASGRIWLNEPGQSTGSSLELELCWM